MDLFVLAADLYVDISETILLNNSDDTQLPMKCLSEIHHWASSTGLTVVIKFKPRLPAQWAVGSHRKGPSRME